MPGGTQTVTPQDQPDKFLLLATNRTGTMQGELNGTPPEHNIAGMTVFRSMFGARLAPYRTPGLDRREVRTANHRGGRGAGSRDPGGRNVLEFRMAVA